MYQLYWEYYHLHGINKGSKVTVTEGISTDDAALQAAYAKAHKIKRYADAITPMQIDGESVMPLYAAVIFSPLKG